MEGCHVPSPTTIAAAAPAKYQTRPRSTKTFKNKGDTDQSPLTCIPFDLRQHTEQQQQLLRSPPLLWPYCV